MPVRLADFTTITRSQAMSEPSDVTDQLAQAAVTLFTTRLPAGHLPVRLLGMGVSGLQWGPAQGLLFDAEERQKQRKLDDVADRIEERLGGAALGRASSTAKGERRKSREP